MKASIRRDVFERLRDCSFCGLCNSACPVFAACGHEPHGPRGKLAIIRQWLKGELQNADIREPLEACAGCGQCERVCPAHLPLSRIFHAARSSAQRRDRLTDTAGGLFYGAPRLLDYVQPFLALAQKLAPGVAPGKYFPPLALRPCAPVRLGSGKGRLVLFAGCVARRLLPDIGRASVRLLAKLGFETLLPGGLACCGGSCAAGLSPEKSMRLARHNLLLLAKLDFDYLVTPCPSCLAAIRTIWPACGGAAIAARARYIGEFFPDVSAPRAAHAAAEVCVHQPCSMPERQSGLACLASANRLAGCCGGRLGRVRPAGASGADASPGAAVGERLRASIAATGAKLVVSDCPRCVLNIAAAFERRLRRPKVVHSAQFYLESDCKMAGADDGGL